MMHRNPNIKLIPGVCELILCGTGHTLLTHQSSLENVDARNDLKESRLNGIYITSITINFNGSFIYTHTHTNTH